MSEADWYFLVNACRNIKTLVTPFNRHNASMLDALVDVVIRRQLEISSEDWHSADVRLVRMSVPDIESLTVKGTWRSSLKLELTSGWSRLVVLRDVICPNQCGTGWKSTPSAKYQNALQPNC